MRLRRIELTNYRGVSHSVVDFADGITIVEGENEVGKSSIAEAIRLIRTAKSGSRTAVIRGLQPDGQDVGPEVTLTIETGDLVLTYRKRWLKNPATSLTIEGARRESLTSDTAHDRFLEILADTVDIDLLNQLDTEQGTSLDQPQLANITALTDALSDSGGASGDNDDLMDRVDSEYERYFTRTGRVGKEYDGVKAAATKAAQALAQAQADLAEVDTLADRHRAHAAKAAEAKENLASARKSQQELADKDRALTDLRTQVAEAEQALADANGQHAAALAAQAARVALRDEAADRARTVGQHDEDEKAAKSLLDAAQKQLQEASDADGRAQAEAREAHSSARTAKDRLEQHRARVRLAEVATKFASATEANEEVQSIGAQVAANRIDDAALFRLTDLEGDLRVARAARESAAPILRVTRLGDAEVTLDGSSIATGDTRDLHVLDATTIEAPGIVRVELTPGATPDGLSTQLQDAERALADALAAAGVDTLDDARAKGEARRSAETELTAAKSRLAALLSGTTLDALRDEEAALRASVTAHARDAQPGAGGTGEEQGTAGDDHGIADGAQGTAGGDSNPNAVDAQPGVDEADRASIADDDAADLAEKARDAEQRDEAAREAAEKSTLALATARTTFDDARASHIRIATSLDSARVEAEQAAARLEVARGEVSDEDLAAQVATAVARVEQATVALTTAQAALAERDADQLAREIENAVDLVNRFARELEQHDKEATRVQAVLDDRASKGLFDTVDQAQAASDLALAELARMDRAASAVAMLRETLHKHRAAAKSRYVAPFRERIEALGRPIFGRDFQVHVGDDLTIKSRTLNGVTVEFDSLSAGAREQLALIGRLACAELVDPARGAPLVLDDTFGFADPERLKAINLVLGATGKHAQIILLTCQPGRFKELGNAHVVTLFGS